MGDVNDDTTTPIDLDARRPGEPLGRAWFGLQQASDRTGDCVRSLRAEWNQAPPARKATLALAIADALRELADNGHDLAHQLEDFARRAAHLDDPHAPGVGSST